MLYFDNYDDRHLFVNSPRPRPYILHCSGAMVLTRMIHTLDFCMYSLSRNLKCNLLSDQIHVSHFVKALLTADVGLFTSYMHTYFEYRS